MGSTALLDLFLFYLSITVAAFLFLIISSLLTLSFKKKKSIRYIELYKGYMLRLFVVLKILHDNFISSSFDIW